MNPSRGSDTATHPTSPISPTSTTSQAQSRVYGSSATPANANQSYVPIRPAATSQQPQTGTSSSMGQVEIRSDVKISRPQTTYHSHPDHQQPPTTSRPLAASHSTETGVSHSQGHGELRADAKNVRPQNNYHYQTDHGQPPQPASRPQPLHYSYEPSNLSYRMQPSRRHSEYASSPTQPYLSGKTQPPSVLTSTSAPTTTVTAYPPTPTTSTPVQQPLQPPVTRAQMTITGQTSVDHSLVPLVEQFYQALSNTMNSIVLAERNTPLQTINRLRTQRDALRDQLQRIQADLAESDRMRGENERIKLENERLRKEAVKVPTLFMENERLKREVERLTAMVDGRAIPRTSKTVDDERQLTSDLQNYQIRPPQISEPPNMSHRSSHDSQKTAVESPVMRAKMEPVDEPLPPAPMDSKTFPLPPPARPLVPARSQLARAPSVEGMTNLNQRSSLPPMVIAPTLTESPVEAPKLPPLVRHDSLPANVPAASRSGRNSRQTSVASSPEMSTRNVTLPPLMRRHEPEHVAPPDSLPSSITVTSRSRQTSVSSSPEMSAKSVLPRNEAIARPSPSPRRSPPLPVARRPGSSGSHHSASVPSAPLQMRRTGCTLPPTLSPRSVPNSLPRPSSRSTAPAFSLEFHRQTDGPTTSEPLPRPRGGAAALPHRIPSSDSLPPQGPLPRPSSKNTVPPEPTTLAPIAGVHPNGVAPHFYGVLKPVSANSSSPPEQQKRVELSPSSFYQPLPASSRKRSRDRYEGESGSDMDPEEREERSWPPSPPKKVMKNEPPPAPQPEKKRGLGIQHLKALYDEIGGEYRCIPCRKSNLPITKFPLNTKWPDLVNHSTQEHSEVCEEILGRGRVGILEWGLRSGGGGSVVTKKGRK